MKMLTVYEANGRRFDKESDALKHEEYCGALDEAFALLRTPVDADCSFGNGHGYVKQDAARIARFVSEVGDAIRKFESEELADKWVICPAGIVGRHLDDINSPAYKAYSRLACIDGAHREWGQQYFANHPTEGDQVDWPIVEEPTR